MSIDLRHHYGAMFGSMPSEVPLSITLQIQATDCNPALHWLLPNRGVEFVAPPCHVARKLLQIFTAGWQV
jgi:hypothetical protein